MTKKLSKTKVLVAGVARNCQSSLENEIRVINEAFSDAEKICWLIIESDSDDSTLQTLNRLSSLYEINAISLGRLQNQNPKRTDRIAVCRNKYLEEIRTNSDYRDIDFVVIADLDGVNSKLSKKSINQLWERDLNWDACFANQSAPYYDIWALRHEIWSPNDCWEYYRFLRKHGASEIYAAHAAVYSRMIQLNSERDPIEVKSAFGGLGIYKIDAVLKAKYVGLKPNGDEVCEHVAFNEKLQQLGYKLYIIPSLINSGWNDHNRILQKN